MVNFVKRKIIFVVLLVLAATGLTCFVFFNAPIKDLLEIVQEETTHGKLQKLPENRVQKSFEKSTINILGKPSEKNNSNNSSPKPPPKLISKSTPKPDPIKCFGVKDKSLPNILESGPIKGNSIFFHETSCRSYDSGKIVISSRQACAVESAARLNPNSEIYLIYTSPGVLKLEETESDNFLKVLMSYKNVNLRHLNYAEYLDKTPVESLWKNKKIQNSHYVVSHASDVLRYLTLWKYGGTYLDLDVIVKKSLEDLPPNYAAPESETYINSAVLNFGATGYGHAIASLCLEDLRFRFDGINWPNNGPGVITRVSKILCGSQDLIKITNTTCMGNFTLYPREAFYAVPWNNWNLFFDENRIKNVDEMTKNSYVLHTWNNLNDKKKVPVDAKVPYTKYIKTYCPLVFNACKEGF